MRHACGKDAWCTTFGVDRIAEVIILDKACDQRRPCRDRLAMHPDRPIIDIGRRGGDLLHQGLICIGADMRLEAVFACSS